MKKLWILGILIVVFLASVPLLWHWLRPIGDRYDVKLTFVDYCQGVDAGDVELNKTLQAIQNLVNEKDCQKAADKLQALRTLDLHKQGLKDIRPLNGLNKLQALNLLGNAIEDAAPLATLTDLQRLTLQGNRIKDSRPLAALSKLTWLDLSTNQISDLEPLKQLQDLSLLRLDGNPIENVAALRDLKKLERYEFFDGLSLEDIPLGRKPLKTEENCPRGETISQALHAFCSNPS